MDTRSGCWLLPMVLTLHLLSACLALVHVELTRRDPTQHGELFPSGPAVASRDRDDTVTARLIETNQTSLDRHRIAGIAAYR